MMTAFANVDSAREAFLLGAYDFVQKPFDNDLLKETVARALEKISLIKEKEALLATYAAAMGKPPISWPVVRGSAAA